MEITDYIYTFKRYFSSLFSHILYVSSRKYQNNLIIQSLKTCHCQSPLLFVIARPTLSCHCVVFPSLVIASTTKWCVAICGASWFVIARPHQGPKQSLFWVSLYTWVPEIGASGQNTPFLAMTVGARRLHHSCLRHFSQ